MKIFLLLLTSVLTNCLFAQSLSEAERYFESFEYAKAAEIYEAYSKKKKLPIDDYKRLGYSYYLIGDYSKCQPISDSIIQLKNTEPLFYYINGEVHMGMKNYEQARASYLMYQKLDNEFDVSIKIQSCELIPTWTATEYRDLTNSELNNSKANIVGPVYNKSSFYVSEIGTDSLGNIITENIDEGVLVLARPYELSSSGNSNPVSFEFPNQRISFGPMAFINGTDDVIVTISQPLAKNDIDLVPHLYQGKYDSEQHTISMLTPWIYSGLNDSTACAHPTINESGNIIVFTKSGQGTKNADLFVAKKDGETWSRPKPIRSLNTSFDEMYPFFSGDTLLAFSSDGYPGYGGLDIFVAKVDGDKFGEAEHLNEPVNSMKDDFNYLYLSADSAAFTSNRAGGHGDDDIYHITYTIPEVIEEPDSADFTDFVINWENANIYFEFDKYDLEKSMGDNIDKIVSFLNKYPSSNLIVEGHTDRRGSAEYNERLGYNRAKSVKYALTQKGIKADQIEVVSKGESEPQVDCSDRCTESEHAKNRVVIVKLSAQ